MAHLLHHQAPSEQQQLPPTTISSSGHMHTSIGGGKPEATAAESAAGNPFDVTTTESSSFAGGVRSPRSVARAVVTASKMESASQQPQLQLPQPMKQVNPFDDDNATTPPSTSVATNNGTSSAPSSGAASISGNANDLLMSSLVGNGGSREGVHPLHAGSGTAQTQQTPQAQQQTPQAQQQQVHPLLQNIPSHAPTAQMPPRPPKRSGRGHRSARTLCTSELSSVAALAGSGVTNGDPFADPTTPHTTPTTTPEVSKAQLSELAAALSSMKPRALNETERAEEAAALARETLGENPEQSTGTSKSHHARVRGGGIDTGVSPEGESKLLGGKGVLHKGLKSPKGPKGGKGHRRTGSIEQIKNLVAPHRKAKSLGMADWMGIVDQVNEAGGGSRDNRDYRRSSGLHVSLGGGKGSGSSSSPGSRPGSRPGSVPNSPGVVAAAAAAAAIAAVAAPDIRSSPGQGGKRDRLTPVVSGKALEIDGENDALTAGLLRLTVPNLDDVDSAAAPSKSAAASKSTTPPQPASEPAAAVAAAEAAPAGPAKSDSFASESSTAAASVAAAPAPLAATEGVPSLRSSEQDPAPHQVDIPPVDEFLRTVRVCSVMDNYRLVDQNFDFGTLAGRSRIGLEGFAEGNDGGAVPGSAEDAAAAAALALQPAHRPIVSSLLECGDDLVVEGFYHELSGAGLDGDGNLDSVSARTAKEDDTGTARDKATDDRVEVAVLSSPRHRQFIVVWRGPTDDQIKPVRNRHLRHARDVMAKEGVHSADLAEDQPVPVFPAYRDSYLKPGLESGVFAKLDELSDRTPFCDVVMTGHSFGAALATLAAVRYAASRPMMRVSCLTYGSPRVGGVDFRHWANSLPNLKVMRVEYGCDPWVNAPEAHGGGGGGTAVWTHVGSSVAITSAVVSTLPAGASLPSENGSDRGGGGGGGNSNGGGENGATGGGGGDSKAEHRPVRAYRFDHLRPSHAGSFLTSMAKSMKMGHHGLSTAGLSKAERTDHALDAYVTAVERIAHLGMPWPTDYVGEDAGGGVVRGADHEKRLVV